jgi:NTE family protein
MDKNVIGVFEGGGIRGIASAGAAAAAMDAGYVFERVVGTSAGALVGSLVAAGFTSKELRTLVCDVDWPGLLDPDPFARIPGIGRHLAMLRRQGVYTGKALERTWSHLLEKRGIRTFSDLVSADSPTTAFRVIVTDVTHVRGLVFPDHLAELDLDPDTTPVAWAVRASAAVPFVFQPVRVKRDGHETLLTDGAMSANFGLRVVDLCAGLPILGFRFTTGTTEERHHPINGPLSFAAAVVASGIKARDALGSLPNIEAEVIEVPADREPLDFNITREEAAHMFDAGYAATAQQLSHNHQTEGADHSA